MHLDPLQFPSCWQSSPYIGQLETCWREHVPFGSALIEMARPSCVVELGVFNGASYLTFCQAVQSLGLNTRCFGIDTWEGDDHNGYYNLEVYERLKARHDPFFGSFSQLLKSNFDNAVAHFGDGEIDLLHIDGWHTYDAVKNDFETWQPKLSDRAVVLFHDTNVRERDFGVWRFWQELTARYPHFEFHHGHGLGVLGFGPQLPESLGALLALDDQNAASVRAFYWTLGNNLSLSFAITENRRSLDESRQLNDNLQRQLAVIQNSPGLRLQEAVAKIPGATRTVRALFPSKESL